MAACAFDDAGVAFQHVVDFAGKRVEVGAVVRADAVLAAVVYGAQCVMQAA